MKPVPQMPNVAECDKLTWSQLESKIFEFNKQHNIKYAGPENQPLVICRVVFNPTKSEWRKYQTKWVDGKEIDDLEHPITYTLAGCTYEFNNLGKHWDPSIGGDSIFGHSLDPNESDSFGIKLSDYIGDWVIDYCYIVEINGERKYQ